MTVPKISTNIAGGAWECGVRVSRTDKTDQHELGTIIGANGQIKVRWDSGQTSYYHRSKLTNLSLAKPPQ